MFGAIFHVSSSNVPEHDSYAIQRKAETSADSDRATKLPLIRKVAQLYHELSFLQHIKSRISTIQFRSPHKSSSSQKLNKVCRRYLGVCTYILQQNSDLPRRQIPNNLLDKFITIFTIEINPRRGSYRVRQSHPAKQIVRAPFVAGSGEDRRLAPVDAAQPGGYRRRTKADCHGQVSVHVRSQLDDTGLLARNGH